MNTGKCPKCENILTSVKIESMNISISFAPAWNGVSYVCPRCSAILGVSMDPIALKADIVSEVLEGIGR